MSTQSQGLQVNASNSNSSNSNSPSTSQPPSTTTTPNGTPAPVTKKKSQSYIGTKLEQRKNHRRTLRGNGKLVWVPDSEADYCGLCGHAFNLIKRKHHCRKCGNIFCDSCSDHKINVPEHGFNKPVRVCSRCAEAGFFLSPGETSGHIPKPFVNEMNGEMPPEEKEEHERFQQQHLMNLKERKRDYTLVNEHHEGPVPTADSVKTFSLPASAKMLPLSDGSVIQRGLLNFTIRSVTGKACAINPIIPYIPTSQRSLHFSQFITKSGRFKKMSFGDTAQWNDGELKLKGIELSWDVEGEGEGWARMGAGSQIKVLDQGKENFVVEVSTYEATTQMWNLINGMHSSEVDKMAKICVYFRFESSESRDQWVLSLKHNMYSFISTNDCFIHTRQKFIAYCRQVGVIGAEDMNWQEILDTLYTSN